MVKKRWWCQKGCGRKVRFQEVKPFEFDGEKKQRAIYFCEGCKKVFTNINFDSKEKIFVEVTSENSPFSVWSNSFVEEIDLMKNFEYLNSRFFKNPTL